MNPSEYFPLLAIPKFNNNGSLLSRKGAIVYRGRCLKKKRLSFDTRFYILNLPTTAFNSVDVIAN